MAFPLSTPQDPHVAVLLGAYKGEDFISDQLKSIFSQTHKNISLWVSVDSDNPNHETDPFYQFLVNYQKNLGDRTRQITILKGPCQGSNRNFLSLVCNEEIQADYFAYADQDDIWHPDKIARALSHLQKYSPEIPSLYCSRTALVDKNGQSIGLSPLFKKKPDFANALVQSLGGGNTMMFNKTTREVLKSIGAVDIVCHDWWTYLVVSAMEGAVIYDPIPCLDYRQHDNNLVGANRSWKARLSRIKLLLKGQFRIWNDINRAALEKAESYMSPKSKERFLIFSQSRKKTLIFQRSWGIRKSGVYRQTFMGNMGLFLAVILKKI
jgi:glycosyltransferase involved in cell wall biosynthesis